MICSCGSVLVSNGDTWSCAIAEQDLFRVQNDNPNAKPVFEHQYKHSAPKADLRLTLNKSVTVAREPGLYNGDSRPCRRKDRLHKDTLAVCSVCNPAGYFKARRMRDQLLRRSA